MVLLNTCYLEEYLVEVMGRESGVSYRHIGRRHDSFDACQRALIRLAA